MDGKQDGVSVDAWSLPKTILSVGFIRASPLIKSRQRSAGLSDQSTSLLGWGFDVEEMRLDWETPGRRGPIIPGLVWEDAEAWASQHVQLLSAERGNEMVRKKCVCVWRYLLGFQVVYKVVTCCTTTTTTTTRRNDYFSTLQHFEVPLFFLLSSCFQFCIDLHLPTFVVQKATSL